MANLAVNYLGLELKNPIVVGANNMSYDLSMLQRIEAAGAAAIVFKSLFEEQIMLERMQLNEQLNEYNDRHAEMTRLFPNLEHAGPEEYLMKLRQAVMTLKIPVFASLNCVQEETWLEYAKRIESAGAAGIELNLYNIPMDENISPSEIIEEQKNIVAKVSAAVKIPVSVKLSYFISNPLFLVKELVSAGAKGVVLFNRLFQPDIDVQAEEMSFNQYIGSRDDHRIALRFAGLLSGKTSASIIASSGIQTAEDVVKLILAGADATQIVSTIYLNKPEYIARMLSDLELWMNQKSYLSINDFKGKLSHNKIDDPFAYKRAQYIDILMHSDEIFKKYPMI